MKIGVSVSTYANEKTSVERMAMSKESIDSMIKNLGKNCIFSVVDDGSTNVIHLKYLNSLRKKGITIIRRETNGGVAYSKNNGIFHALQNKIDFGFLLDDDIIINSKEYIEKYYNAYRKTGIHHFNLAIKIFHKYLYNDQGVVANKFIKEINGVKVIVCGLINGALFTYTPEMISKIGYLQILPGKYGQSHVNFTHRATHNKFTNGVRFPDIVGSDKLISFNPHAWTHFADTTFNRPQSAKKNSPYLRTRLNDFVEKNI